MANKKFSQFTSVTSVDQSTGFLVGYDSTLNDNIRFTAGDLRTSLGLDINYVLSLGGIFTADRSVNQDGNNLSFNNAKDYSVVSANWGTMIKVDDAAASASFGSSDSLAGTFFKADVSLNEAYINSIDIKFGLYNSSGQHHMYSNYLGYKMGINVEFANGVYVFGDNQGYYNGNNSAFISYCSNTESLASIQTYWFPDDINIELHQSSKGDTFGVRRNGTELGLWLSFYNGLYYFGDFNGTLGNAQYIQLDVPSGIFTLAADNIKLIGSNITTPSSGSSSGQHLKVTINGSDYVIELRNP